MFFANYKLYCSPVYFLAYGILKPPEILDLPALPQQIYPKNMFLPFFVKTFS